MSVTQKKVANATSATMQIETWCPNEDASGSSIQHGIHEQRKLDT